MIRRTTAFPLLLVAFTSLATLTGCGSDSGGNATGTPKTQAVADGGTFTGDYASMPDSLDPALAYTAEAWGSLWPVYTSLLTYKHAEGVEGATIEPGLAKALPTISADGRTYDLQLRDGLTYSDGKPVKASDVAYAIKRVLRLESGGAFLFEGIEGATDYEDAKADDAPIKGIVTDDATGKITFKLKAADPQFSYSLAMIFSAPVPAGTPFENSTTDPMPGVGPFKLTDVKAGRGWVLEKVPTFKALPFVPAAKADRVEISIVGNQRRSAQDLIANKVDFLEDAPVPDSLQELRQQASDRFKTYPTNSTYYFFLNTQTKPFDDEQVRLAVGTAVDERAIARLYGGLMEPDCNYLPPGVAGYQKLNPCPFGPVDQAPDVAKAKSLIQQAGAEGAKVSVYTDDAETSKAVTDYVVDVMNSIGLKATSKVLTADTYFQAVGNQSTKAQAGFTNWSQDYPSPANFFQLIDGANISPTNNQNFGNVDDADINRTLAEADAKTDPEQAAGLYAAIDRRLVSKAYVIPFGHKDGTKATSSRVAFDAFQYHPVNGLDFTTLGLAK